jgi:POLQ-like helicase
VVLRSPFIGNLRLSHSQYKQMVGRAGRKGLAEAGDSILMAHASDQKKVLELLASPYDCCESSLLSKGATALASLILSLVGLKLATTTSDLQSFLEATLYYRQSRDHTHFLSYCQETVASLAADGYITMETDEGGGARLGATALGRAAVRGCVPVHSVGRVFRELSHAQSSLVLSTNLHLLFLATPTDHALSIRPNWLVFFQTLTGLGEDEVRVAEKVGVSPSVLSKLATGSAASMSGEASLLYHRFYLSLMMHRLISGPRSQGSGGVASENRGVWSVAEHFQCSRGFVQSSVSSVASFATCLIHFTQELPELWALHLLLPSVAEQLSHLASADLAPLMEIPGVRQGRARQLLQAGYPTPESLAAVSPTDLCESVAHLYPRQARRIVQTAKALVRDRAEVLFEEAEDLIAGLT